MTSLANAVSDEITRREPAPPLLLARALYTFCEELQEPYHPGLFSAITSCFCQGVFKRIPPSFTTTRKEFFEAFQKWDTDPSSYTKVPTIPLYELLPIGDVIESIHGHFLYDYHNLAQDNLLGSLRQQLRKNDASANGLSVYERSKRKVPAPSERDEPPEKLVELYLHHTPFFEFFYTQLPLTIERERFQEHGFFLPEAGMAKRKDYAQSFLNFCRNKTRPRSSLSIASVRSSKASSTLRFLPLPCATAFLSSTRRDRNTYHA